jgi:multimeric flavodoxin WrbA
MRLPDAGAVLGISASPRAGGNSDVLLRTILEAAGQAGAGTETVFLRDLNFQSCSGCEKCRKTGRCDGLADDMTGIYPLLEASAGLVLVTPIHHYNMTALMKAFIDRLYCYYEFGCTRPGPWHSRLAGQGRRVVLVAVGEQLADDDSGMRLTLETLRLSVTALGYDIAGELPVTGVFGKGRVKQETAVLAQTRELGRRLAER